MWKKYASWSQWNPKTFSQIACILNAILKNLPGFKGKQIFAAEMIFIEILVEESRVDYRINFLGLTIFCTECRRKDKLPNIAENE